TFNDNEIKQIKSIVPEKFEKDETLSIESKFKNVVFPNSKMKAKTYETYVVNNVDNIKFLRTRVLKSLKKATQKQKSRILTQMADVELKMAQSIKDSPPPDGLNEAQLLEYKNGLNDMAKEYEKQAQDFTTAKQEVDASLKKQADDEAESILPVISEDDWSLSKNENFDKVSEIFNKISVKAAMIFIDNLMFNKKIETSEYYNLKTWIILKLRPSESLRKLYHDELLQANQNEVIIKWKGLKK
ncbi:MAG: hypothetical protein KDD45_13305, partial [Bdellovibrionales bacterium]|nr:hypothetical protein [Bdellovibrionales bacterium]